MCKQNFFENPPNNLYNMLLFCFVLICLQNCRELYANKHFLTMNMKILSVQEVLMSYYTRSCNIKNRIEDETGKTFYVRITPWRLLNTIRKCVYTGLGKVSVRLFVWKIIQSLIIL